MDLIQENQRDMARVFTEDKEGGHVAESDRKWSCVQNNTGDLPCLEIPFKVIEFILSAVNYLLTLYI